MTDRHPFIKWLKKKNACTAGITFARHFSSPAVAYKAALKSSTTKELATWLLGKLGYDHKNPIADCYCQAPGKYYPTLPRTPWVPRVATAKRTKAAAGKKAPTTKRKVVKKAKKGTN